MKYYETEIWPHLLAAIKANPADDLPRLVAADFLEENGESERAEWMRFSIASPSVMGCMGDSSVGQGCPYTPGRGEKLWCPNCDIAIGWGLPERIAGEGGYEYLRGFVHTVRAPLSALIGGECPTCVSWMENHDCYNCNGTGRTVGVLPELVKREPVERVEVTDMPIFPSGGNSTYYVGGLGRLPSEYWRELDSLPTESAARDALSAVLIRMASQPVCELK